MELKVEITSKETIKPSSPTPAHVRTYNLNVLDQLALCTTNVHIPVLLFYRNTLSQNQTETSSHLKKSLQETLTHFYPLAGRTKGYSYIDCNDAGVTYIETRAVGNIEEVIKEPKLEKLKQLLPVDPYENCIHPFSVPEMLLIQVNYFNGGGVVVGVCMSHIICDAATLGNFVETWAAIARGNVSDFNGVVTDTTSIFPSFDDSEAFYFLSQNNQVTTDLLLGVVNNRFVFEGSRIAALKRKIGSLTMPAGNSNKLDFPTRFEALCALIMGVLLSITEEKRNNHVALVLVNLRSRMNPPLPTQCLGNVVQAKPLMSLSNKNEIDYNYLARKVRESVTSTNDENVRKFHATGGMLNFAKALYAEMEKRKDSESSGLGVVAAFSSWCNFPFYEADFGRGKPIWVATALNQNRAVYFLDSRDGQGIEVSLGLHPQLMSKFEQNPDIIEFASFVPTT